MRGMLSLYPNPSEGRAVAWLFVKPTLALQEIGRHCFATQEHRPAHLAWPQPEPDLVGVSTREALPFRDLRHSEGQEPVSVQIGGDLWIIRIHGSPAEQLGQRLVCPLIVVYPLHLHSNGVGCQEQQQKASESILRLHQRPLPGLDAAVAQLIRSSTCITSR